jgi:predicted transcriptional regulator
MPTIKVSEEVMATLRKLAAARRTDIPGILAEAIGLEQAYVDALLSGSRLLVEKRGRVDELVVPEPQVSRSA